MAPALYCQKLLGSNELVTFILNYEDILDDNNPEEQCFIANLRMANLKKKKQLESKSNSIQLCAPVQSVLLITSFGYIK